MSVFNPYKVSREKHNSRAFHFENDKDQLTSVAKFETDGKGESNISIIIFHVSLSYKILVTLMTFSTKLKGGKRFSSLYL